MVRVGHHDVRGTSPASLEIIHVITDMYVHFSGTSVRRNTVQGGRTAARWKAGTRNSGRQWNVSTNEYRKLPLGVQKHL